MLKLLAEEAKTGIRDGGHKKLPSGATHARLQGVTGSHSTRALPNSELFSNCSMWTEVDEVVDPRGRDKDVELKHNEHNEYHLEDKHNRTVCMCRPG